MLNKFRALIAPCGLIVLALLFLTGCSSSDNSNKTSISSGTITGSGSSGGAAAQVSVTAASNPIGSTATTTITVIVTDAQGRRTDASIIVTSNGGGTFNGSATTVNANTLGGVLIVTYKPDTTGDIEIAVTVTGTSVRGSTILTVL